MLKDGRCPIDTAPVWCVLQKFRGSQQEGEGGSWIEERCAHILLDEEPNEGFLVPRH